MWTEETEILEASRQLGISVIPLEGEVSREIIREVVLKFCESGSRGSSRVFERLVNCVAMSGENLLQKLSSIASGQSVFVFAEPGTETKVFQFENGEDVGRVLEECANFSTYVVPTDCKYLMCLTCEGTLVGSGELANSTDSRRREHK